MPTERNRTEVPVTRRTTLRSLAAVGAGAAGLGAANGVSTRGTALQSGAPSEVPVWVERKMGRETGGTRHYDTHWVTDATLWYWGANWEPSGTGRPDEGRWNHKFMLAATGWQYRNDDPIGQDIEWTDGGLIKNQGIAVEPRDDEVNVTAPSADPIVDAAEPATLEEELAEDPDVDLVETAVELHEQGTDPEPVDLEEEMDGWGEPDNTGGPPIGGRHLVAGGTVVLGLNHPIAAGVVTLGSIVHDALNAGSSESVEPDRGFDWDSGDIEFDSTGSVGAHLAMFDVKVPPGASDTIDVSTYFGYHRNGLAQDKEADVSWELDVWGRPAPDERDCVDGSDVWRRSAEAGGTTIHEIAAPAPVLEGPHPRETYHVNEDIDFEADLESVYLMDVDAGEVLENNWWVSHEDLGSCTLLDEGDIEDGTASRELDDTGHWDVELHQRSTAGLSGFESFRIFLYDGDDSIVPTDSPGEIVAEDLSLPAGTDRFTEARFDE